jgi:hypothetical protein
MFVIQKISQHYDFHQDRICFTVQDADSAVMLIWMTQRFSNYLVKALLAILDKHTQASPSGQAVTAAGQSVSGIHVWEQLAAQKQLQPDHTPVKVVQVVREILPDQVEISCKAEQGIKYTLTFKVKAETVACLTFNKVQLRQWLGMFYKTYQKAAWSMQVWPDWFSFYNTHKPPRADYVLH